MTETTSQTVHELPELPGMLPPRQVKEEVSRWEDEGGKPAMSAAERECRLRAERQLLRQQRWANISSAFSQAWQGGAAVKAWIEANPLPAAVASLGTGYILGLLKRR